jgi:glycine/D-amino acid oxidase-like deaminating enzyme
MSLAGCVYADTALGFLGGVRQSGRETADIAVIGAGLTGLSAALHLAERGRGVMVLDRHAPGWGASGRNGGQVNPGLKPDPDEVARQVGGARGAALVHAAWRAPDLVFDIIARHRIACDAARGGTLRVARATRDMEALRRLAGQCRDHGIESAGLLDRDATASRIGSDRYRGALFDRRGGQLNPLAYTRGLAHAAIAAGARIMIDSPALSLTRTGAGWRIATPDGTVEAGQVLLASNGYSDALLPALPRSIVPVYSAIVATAPLPDPIRATILEGRESAYELGRITTYYRIDAGGRLLIGGRSRSRDLSGPDSFRFLQNHARRLWPQVASWRWTHGWNGQLAMTADHLPHLHDPAPGLFACLGYNGRGVAMATLLGREMARWIDGAPKQELLIPPTPIRPIRLHRFWKLGVAWHVASGRALDLIS